MSNPVSDDLVERTYLGPDWYSMIQDLESGKSCNAEAAAALKQANIDRAEAAAQLAALSAERDALAKDLAAQIAGHQETARQGTDALMRANTAAAQLDEAEGRARKHWQAFRDLRLDIIGHGPMCRDCADFDGRCQGNGPPCDPDEAVTEQIAAWKAAAAQLKTAREALEPFDRAASALFTRNFNKADVVVALPVDPSHPNQLRLTAGHFFAVRTALNPKAPSESPSLIEQAFREGLAYGSNVGNADPDLAWKQSRLNPERQEGH